MYSIKFKNGTELALISLDQEILEDRSYCDPKREYSFAYSNAYLAIAGTNGIFNKGIIGQTLEDFDDNIWTFSVSSPTSQSLNVHILKKDGTEITFSADTGLNSQCRLCCNSVDSEGNYEIRLSISRPVYGEFDDSSAGGTRIYWASYLNGVNGEHNMSTDIVSHRDFPSIVARNTICTEDSVFASCFLYYKTPTGRYLTLNEITSVFAGSGSLSNPLFTLSSKTVRKYVEEAEDPYGPGGYSGTGGGTGTFDGTSDAIDIPNLPTLSSVDTGFITLFNPSTAELKSLANYMWSGLFDINTWKKIFADPMDAILGMSIVPVAVPDGGTKVVTVGNISTGISMTVAASQYVSVDCGSLDVEEYWGAYLDYDPYTKAEIYLPYIGTHPIKTDDIMGKTVHVVYHVDILSGSCVAFVKCGESVLYTFIGQCSSSIPITGDNWTNVINGAINIASSIGTMVATGGLSAPITEGGTKAAAAIGAAAANRIGLGSGIAQDVMSMKPEIEKSGAMGGTGGMLAVQTPYLILTRPNQCLPESQNSLEGYPSFVTVSLSSVSGYTRIYAIHLDNIPATQDELIEIENLLKEGVIF